MHAQEKYNAHLFIATINYLTEEVWDFAGDKMEIWDYRTMLNYYDKYFFDPDAGWEEFYNFIQAKESIRASIKKEYAEKIETKDKEILVILTETNKRLFLLLKEIRKNEALKWGIYPNYVFSDAVLYEIAKRRPQTKLEFLRIP